MIENSIELVVELERPEVVIHQGVFFELAKVKSSLKVFGAAQIAPTSAAAAAPESVACFLFKRKASIGSKSAQKALDATHTLGALLVARRREEVHALCLSICIYAFC